VCWEGTSKQDLLTFPKQALEDLGGMLQAVQDGLEPANYKYMAAVGPGAMELRATKVGPQQREFRAIYVAKFDDAIYVLHAFEKKTQKTPKSDIQLAETRYRTLAGRLGKPVR
jgi:phage-related protein